MNADVSPPPEGHRLSQRLRQVGFAVVLGAAVAMASVAPAGADIFPPEWDAQPLPEGADQPGVLSVGGKGCGPSGTVEFEDDFATDGPPDQAKSGQQWETAGSGIFELVRGRIQYTSFETDLGYLVADTGRPDGRLAMTLSDLPETFWVLWRYSDDLNHYRFGRSRGGDYQFHQVINGAVRNFDPFSLDITPRDGDRITVTYEEDDSINIYRDNEWLYGDGQVFNIDETMVGFALADPDASGAQLRVEGLEMAPYSVAAATARVVVSASRDGERVAFEELLPDNDGNWSGRLAVPEDSGAGDYLLEAECSTPGYDLIYPAFNLRLSFVNSQTAITDFVAEVDFSDVDEAGAFDPVTLVVLASLVVLVVAVGAVGVIHARRRGEMPVEG